MSEPGEARRAGAASDNLLRDRQIDIIRAALERWIGSLGSDYAGWIDIADEEIAFFSAADGREPAGFTRRRNRRSELPDYFQSIHRLMEMQHFSVDELFGGDNMVVVLSNSIWRVRDNRRVVHMRAMMIYGFRGEKVIRFENIYDTAALFAALEANRPGERG